MKPYEFTRLYNPRLGKFVYKHKGSGIIVDNIFKPLKSISTSIFKKFAKPVARKALETAVSQTGEKLGKKISEKSGDLIMKKLANIRKGRKTPTTPTMNVPSIMKKEKESTDMIINRLISGSGKGKKRVTFI